MGYWRRQQVRPQVLQDLDIKQAHLYLCPRPSRTTNSFKLFRKKLDTLLLNGLMMNYLKF
jgi:phage portal protein BeeE